LYFDQGGVYLFSLMGYKIKALLAALTLLAVMVPVRVQASEETNLVFAEIKLGGAVQNQSTEFVQIFNDSTQAVTGLTIEYAKPSAAITDCELPWKAQDSANVREVSINGSIEPQALALIELSMNDNAGGSLRLRDNTNIYDVVGWGKEGSTGKCSEGVVASVPSNGKSLKRYVSGSVFVDTNDNAKDFITNQEPLIGFPELPVDEPECVGVACEQPEAPQTTECEVVELSEIMPNPSGVDTGQEYIELFNPTSRAVSLRGCSLIVGSSKQDLTGEIPPGYKIVTGSTLPNAAGGTVQLTSATTEQSVTYPADLADDEAWALIGGMWQITNQPTPNLPNLPSVVTAKPTSDPSLQPCGEGKYRNPETNRCKTIEDEGPAPCAPGQVRNPETNRCRKLSASSLTSLKPCEPGQVRNPETNRCRKTGSSSATLKPCAPGQERNSETNRCRKVAGASTNQASVNSSKPQNNATKISYGLFALLAVVVLGYGAYEYRTEFANLFSRLKPNSKK
jgi:hypothetical protein